MEEKKLNTTLPVSLMPSTGRSETCKYLHTSMPAFFDIFDMNHYNCKKIKFKNQSNEDVSAVELTLHDTVFLLMPSCAEDLARQLSKASQAEIV